MEAAAWLLSWEQPWLSELLSTGYFLFYFLVLLPVIGFAKRRHEGEARAFFLGLTTMYLVGFSGYLLVPASGPYAAFPELFSYPVQGGAMTAMLTKLVAAGITGMDVFPSLHSGIGVYVLGYFALGGHRLGGHDGDLPGGRVLVEAERFLVGEGAFLGVAHPAACPWARSRYERGRNL